MRNFNDVIVNYVQEDARFHNFAIRKRANMRGYKTIAIAKALWELGITLAIIGVAWLSIMAFWVIFY
jgi:hypothetical protein